MSVDRISNLKSVSLLVMDNEESRVRRGKSARKVPVVLCRTERKCLVKRSLGSSTSPRYLICGLHGMTDCWNRSGGGVAGRRLVNNMASVLLNKT